MAMSLPIVSPHSLLLGAESISMTGLLSTSLVCHGIFNTLDIRAGNSQPCLYFGKGLVLNYILYVPNTMCLLKRIFLCFTKPRSGKRTTFREGPGKVVMVAIWM